MKKRTDFIYSLKEVDKNAWEIAGGKGANLGELCQINGILVPDGYCITTHAFEAILGIASVHNLLGQLATLKTTDRSHISKISAALRNAIENAPLPAELIDAIAQMHLQVGENSAFAVRSSATAEDLPNASFAGQQDTYLNIIGLKPLLVHVSKCWASLFTERAITYRLRNGFDHTKVRLAVVIQKMILPRASGIMFTADPFTSNRKRLSIDAGFGLGEAFVSGIVAADNYQVQNGQVVHKTIAVKKSAIFPLKEGGTVQQDNTPEDQNAQVLSDEQILELGHIGRKIETHFGCPQDIEWCLADGLFYIVQSRPATTLYPTPSLPAISGLPATIDSGNHAYISVGHQQMMTDAMKPLGLSVWQLTTPRPMHEAGGRLFVDVTADLASPSRRHLMINVLGNSDPLLKDALATLVERPDFIELQPEEEQVTLPDKGAQPQRIDFLALKDYDAQTVSDLIRRSEASLSELALQIQAKSGPELFDFIVEDTLESKRLLQDPQNTGVIMTAMNAASWLNEKMEIWLGEKNVSDILSQSVSGNITAEMGLALLDVADVIRPYPGVVEYLQQVKDEHFLEGLQAYHGGREAREAIERFLDKYGMRCAGEIDITRPRWSEQPTTLIPALLGNIRNFGPGAAKQKFEKGLQNASKKEKELIEQLRQLPESDQKIKETQRMIGLVRNLAGYREYSKYSIVNRYFIYKQALLREADKLVRNGQFHDREDCFYLRFEEFREAVRTGKINVSVIIQRKEEYKLFEKLVPPRLITSDGEIIAGRYKREHIPQDAVAGLPVSRGIVEGRARVVLDMKDANLETGDILVTVFTDPSWTPLFVSVKGVITEVGGLMTHGAVIAREYGLPAVVGVTNATTLIRDGQYIRLNGTEGYVEIL